MQQASLLAELLPSVSKHNARAVQQSEVGLRPAARRRPADGREPRGQQAPHQPRGAPSAAEHLHSLSACWSAARHLPPHTCVYTHLKANVKMSTAALFTKHGNWKP